ncbi:PAS domain-containing protein [Flavobacterium sp.]|uniref:PAS domain-containing protein n=1 Tax=Flavobacterium sp. TaxID=239 RepID=UPI002B4ABE43|nr:PAS domain-containing protein [Flavobacterium sp.]HLF51917.1 PAS domain-containing protein [Flavobacterium sp.]
MKEQKPTYDYLLNKTKDQELEINRLLEHKESINNFEFYQKESQDLVCIAGIDGFFKEINPTFIKVLGYTKEELLTNSMLSFIHPDDVEKTTRELKQLSLGHHTSINFENRYIKKNKDIVTIQWTTTKSASKEFIYAIGRDIIEKKKAIETLKEERDKFAKIAATSPGLIYSMRQNKDGSLYYPYASNAIDEIYGFAYEDIKNDPNKLFSLIHPDDLDYVMQSIIETKSKLVPLKGQYRYFHPKKGMVWHEMNSLPVVEPEGTVICHGIITDITERIRAEQKLIKANRLYLFISEINQMIVHTTDVQALFREACTIAVDIGKFRMAWIGTIDEDTKKLIPAMIAGEDQGYLSIIKKISAEDIPAGRGPGGTSIREGRSVICNDIENDSIMRPWRKEALKRGYCSSMAVPLKKFGKVIGAFSFYANEKNFFDAEEIALLEKATDDVAFALEIFEKEALRKKAEESVIESEQRYHMLTEVSPVGIFRTDATGHTTYVNARWCQITGLSFQEAMGTGWLNAVHNEDRTALSNVWENATRQKENFLYEYRFVRPNRSIAWVIAQAIPEKNSENQIVGYIGTTTDITERKLMEMELIKAKDLAETANKAKTDFLANMSHEIRTPLNGIIGFTHLLMKSNLKKNQSEYMATVNESAISLMEIVNDILDFSKIESGKLELNINEINLFKLTNQVIGLFKHQANQKKIDLILQIDKNVPQYILSDSVRLKQILVNLLSNAIKFTNFGEIQLDINEIEPSDKKWSTIKFSVKDTGVGIKTDNNEKIFNSFVQEDNSTNRKFGGTGLGLAISNRLLALMDSKLQLISKYGEGSDFFFVIKFKKVNHKKNIDSVLNNIIEEDKIIPVKTLSNKKILIVEDNKINMLLAKTLIKRIISNCTIFEAKDGNEAIEQYKKEKPDLVLMDIQMPNKNGYEATDEIRKLKDAENIPIIAITAGIMDGDKEKCLVSGMNDYLSKPIIQTDLEKILHKWLHKN